MKCPFNRNRTPFFGLQKLCKFNACIAFAPKQRLYKSIRGYFKFFLLQQWWFFAADAMVAKKTGRRVNSNVIWWRSHCFMQSLEMHWRCTGVSLLQNFPQHCTGKPAIFVILRGPKTWSWIFLKKKNYQICPKRITNITSQNSTWSPSCLRKIKKSNNVVFPFKQSN